MGYSQIKKDKYMIIKGFRTDCFTERTKTVELTIEFGFGLADPDDCWIKITEGAVTGYESARMSDRFISAIRAGGDWHANLGTAKRWDKLVVPNSSLREILTVYENTVRKTA